MHATLFVMIMSSFFNPSFAFSSHFDTDGAPLSELSWSSSLAVVAVSFSGLFTFIFLMLACLCCKKGDIGFKEFENTEGEEYQAEFSTLTSSTSQTGPEVYILPLTEVSLPVSKQPGRSVQLLKSTDLGRHSLLYLKEIGHGWFGKVLLGEVNAGLSTTQVVVKELKASASVQDQMQFLEEVQPYRSLQHPHLLQCLAQCTEVTPYLLVMEFCPLGDLKGYLRSCRAADSMTPDPLTLQRMACEIASGLLHLHKYNFVHSDLALRNCLLTAEVTVKIGDYGLSHNKYKDDYFVTVDQLWVPLRWIAPELIDEVHGNLLVVDQTKPSNIWSLGVTIWELFELGNQPYRHYSDRQVLTYAIKEQQLKLPKPLLKLPLSERWYEVLQFCWLQPDQRPTAEEVHLLLSYLCAKGASEAEEDFEKRWNSLRPNSGNSSTHSASAAEQPPSSSSSSFPLLEHFSVGDGFHSEAGDDILTVTETSRGLNFEYKWEQARPEQHYPSSSSSGALGHSQYQDIYYAPGGGVSGSSCSGGLTLGVSPSYYDSKPLGLHTPGVVPVLSAHSPSVSNEYYIRIEEPSECNIDLDYTMCSYSPELGGSNGSFIGGGGGSGDCDNCPSEAQPNSYWLDEARKASAYDSDNSPAISLTMEPLLGQMSTTSPVEPWESEQYYSYKVQEKEQGCYYDQSSLDGADHYLLEDSSENHRESWGSRSLRQALGELEDPLGVSPSLGGPQQLYRDPYIEGSRPALSKRSAGECYYDMTGSLRKNLPGSNTVCVDMEEEVSGLFIGRRDSDLEEVDMFAEKEALAQANHWTSNSSANNNSLSFSKRSGNNIHGYANFHFTMPSAGLEESWHVFKAKENLTYPASQAFPYLEAATCTEEGGTPLTNEHKLFPSSESNSYVYPYHEEEERMSPPEEHNTYQEHGFVDPLLGSVVRSYALNDYIKQKQTMGLKKENGESSPSTPLGGAVESNVVPETELNPDLASLGKGGTPVDKTEQCMNTVVGRTSCEKEEENEEGCLSEVKHPAQNSIRSVQSEGLTPEMAPSAQSEPHSETSQTTESEVDKGCFSISLVEIDDCSDDDITDVTSGVFTDFPMDYVGDAPPAVKSLQKQAGTPDSIESLELPSTSSFCESFNPTTFHPSSQPKAIDSGYDTENYESPEFVLKEPHDSRDPEGFVQPLGKPSVSEGLEETETEGGAEVCPAVPISTSHSTELQLGGLNEKNPYRDSAYFSDYDAENERYSRNEREEFPEKLDDDIIVPEPEKEDPTADPASLKVEKEEPHQQQQQQDNHVDEKDQFQNDYSGRQFDEQMQRQDIEDGGEILATPEVLETEFVSAHSTPTPSSLTPPELEDEGLELEQELCRDEQYSEICTSSIPEEPAQPEHSGIPDEVQEPSSLKGPLVEASDSATGGGASKNDTETSDCREEGDGREPAEDTTSTGLPSVDNSPQQPHSNLPHVESWGKEFPGEASECQMGRVSPADGEEADEEDGDSEDSEESDEELRCYNIQEQSEESEEELPAVPIVVSDSSEAHNLRSLLKMPSLLSQSFCEELDRKKKAVSFFDDVTVYLFDQSPTRELGDHSFPQGAESSGRSSETGETRPQERVSTSDDSSDGNVSEESGGFEWDDDFPLMPVTSSPMSSLGPAPMDPPVAPSLSPLAPESKQGPAVQYSRFTVSPSSASRFSITHVSDSDVDSVGGEHCTLIRRLERNR
ncbi:serine/threonine-protein kinase LMTK1-like isoform X2 [Polyodon spathula]|uniref:serine/threonine-protein kinase LMTK1-like isoform X2 n=1 Tax=Polyodon spathula TaxID=7913 RepID=UPI001B7E61BB|nr:serine/threonine-protein kinase LMTK1-like isoform X2 [Polyodon spathula]